MSSLMLPCLMMPAADGKTRCWWCGDDPLYVAYHDNEWGFPVTDDTRLFEKITLEGFQSGLSWYTILKKREHFREAFHGFDLERVARMTPASVEKLLKNPGIVRHRGKIESAIHNARQARAVADEFGSLAAYFWQYQPHPSARPTEFTREVLSKIAATPESTALSKDLRKRGWSFVGPTTCYAFMQAMGLVNDHLADCFVRARIKRAPAPAVRPRRRPTGPAAD